MKLAPASVASAFARSVFPVPGGPNNKIPLQGWSQKRKKKKGHQNNKHNKTEASRKLQLTLLTWKRENSYNEVNFTLNKLPWENNSGRFIGKVTSSSSVILTSSSAPISSNFTPISSGGTTADIKLLSYSSLARLYITVYLFAC
jgi:hypothetical protein